MFGRIKKENKNYYVSPFPQEFLDKSAVRASVIIIVTAVLVIPTLVLWIYPGIGSLMWLYGFFEANVAYMLLYVATIVGVTFCAIMSFLGYKIRKEVKQTSAPTFGFRKSSYNGIFFTGVFSGALFIYQVVTLIGYHVSLGTGYIQSLINAHSDLAGKTAGVDVVGIIVCALYALVCAGVWTYYAYTYKINRNMQFVSPEEPQPANTPAIPTKEEAEKHRPDRSYKPLYGLSIEEKEESEKAFKDDEPDQKKGKK